MDNKIEKNVLDFMDKCAKEIGKQSEEFFNINIWNICHRNVESPIEQLLICALYTISRLNYLDNKLTFLPQREIGKYRVDFLITYFDSQSSKKIIVECDSQKFHERNELERRYEKARNRYLQTQGYKVFRFTGSEIFKNPLTVASEIISYMTDMSISEIYTDSGIED